MVQKGDDSIGGAVVSKRTAIRFVDYPANLPLDPPKIPITFEGVLETPLDRQLALLLQLHKGRLGLGVTIAELAKMSTEEKTNLLCKIQDILEIPESVRGLEVFSF